MNKYITRHMNCHSSYRKSETVNYSNIYFDSRALNFLEKFRSIMKFKVRIEYEKGWGHYRQEVEEKKIRTKNPILILFLTP